MDVQVNVHPQHLSLLYTTFDCSSLEKEDFEEGIQVFIFLVVNVICFGNIAHFFCLCLTVIPSILNHQDGWCVAALITRLLFLSNLLFVFALSDDLFKGLRCNSRRSIFRILVIQPLFTVHFCRFIIIFPCGLTAENLANSSFNHTYLVLKGAQLLKFSMLPVLLVSDTFHS